MSAPRFVARDIGGGREWMLAHGPEDGPQLLFVQPLFEEANRCRAVLADVQRRLAAAGIGSWLFDLPGTGDSPRDIANTGWTDWRDAVAEAARASGAGAVAALRGGCLLDNVGLPRWRLAPLDGARALRELGRATGAGRQAAWTLPAGLGAALAAATVAGAARTMRLETDAAPADAQLAGAPPWRRAEPAGDPGLASAIAADIVAWLAP